MKIMKSFSFCNTFKCVLYLFYICSTTYLNTNFISFVNLIDTFNIIFSKLMVYIFKFITEDRIKEH